MIPGCRLCTWGFHEQCELENQCACCYVCPDCGAQTKQEMPHYEHCSFWRLIGVPVNSLYGDSDDTKLPQWVREREQR